MALFRRKTRKQVTPWQVFLLLAVLVSAFGLKIYGAIAPEKTPTSEIPAVSYEDIAQPEPEPQPEPEAEPASDPEPEPVPPPSTPPPLPAQLNLAVPFTSQAPYANWDALHEDTCEEASFYMVQEFYAGTPAGKIDPAVADPELQRLVHAEEELGLTPSISVAEAKDFLWKDSQTVAVIVDNPTVEDIKRLIAFGKPVVLPAAGRELGNPNFTGDGPLYHMLVIRGYTDTTFITNDPGTRLGENYEYDIDVIMEAMGDWINNDPTDGPKRVMYLEPK